MPDGLPPVGPFSSPRSPAEGPSDHEPRRVVPPPMSDAGDPAHLQGVLRSSSVVRISLLRPIALLMALLSMLVVGTFAVVQIPLEMIPSGFTAPVISVTVNYPDATARDIEERITLPLEASLSTTPALDQIISNSASNYSNIILVFDQDTNMDVAYREVRDRVARVRPDLPTDVKRVDVNKQAADSFPIAFFGIRYPESLSDPNEIIQKKLIQPVNRVDGVGLVRAWGLAEREIRIEVDRSLAEAANLNIFEIAQKLQTSHFNLASGQLRVNEGRYLIRSLATFQTAKDLEKVIVGKNDLRLADVARVTYDFPEREEIARYNGQPTMAMFILKESTANTVDVCERVKKAVEAASKDPALSQFEIKPIFLQGDIIKSSLRQVTDSGLQGGLLAVLVLLLFLKRLRLTLVIALSIPLSMFMALPFMYFSGQTLNLVSLIGLMICIGLVVDNSVVVAENIDRYRHRGVGRFAAALHGASEVALPATLATATTMIVFLPAALMSSGPSRFFMIRMVTPVCVSLLASLFVALVLIPLSAAWFYDVDIFADADKRPWLKRLQNIDAAWKHALDVLYDRTLGTVCRGYETLLRAVVVRRFDVVVVALLTMVSIAIPFSAVPVSAEDKFGARQYTITYTMPSDVSIEEADVFFRELEGWFAERREGFGLDGEYLEVEPGIGQLQLFFSPAAAEKEDPALVGQRIFDQLPVPPGWQKRARRGSSDGGEAGVFKLYIFGDDHDTLARVKEEFSQAVLAVEGVKGVVGEQRDSTRRDELALGVDRGLAQRLGVAPSIVGNTVAYAIRGSPLPRFYTENDDIPVWIRYQKSDRERVADLLQFKVPTQGGTPVAIETLVERDVISGQSTLTRTNKRVAVQVKLELDAEQRDKAAVALRTFLQGYNLPPGVSFDPDTESRQSDDMLGNALFALLLASVFIFALMAVLFESVLLPLSVMPSIPLAFVGVWWFLYLTGEAIDGLAIVGIVLLLGVVVNNAIVLIDFINIARGQGLSRDEAIVQGGIQRFRPILMTSATTVLGMIPLAFAAAPADGIPYGAFGKTLVGGMSASTILTLVVVPVFYTMFDDLGAFLLNASRAVFRRRGA